MGLELFVNKFQKPLLLISGAVATVAGILYLIPQDNKVSVEENNNLVEDELEQDYNKYLMENYQNGDYDFDKEDVEEEEEMTMGQLLMQDFDATRLKKTLEEKEDIEESKKAMKLDIAIEYQEEGLLTLSTVQQIYEYAIYMGIDNLIDLHNKGVEERQKHFKDLKYFLKKTQQINEYNSSTIAGGVYTVLYMLDLKQELLFNSEKYYEQNNKLSPDHIREFIQVALPEIASQNEMTLQDCKTYLQFQIESVESEIKLLKNSEEINDNINSEQKYAFLRARVDDLAYFKLGCTDFDGMRAVSQYIFDTNVEKLQNKLTQTIELYC